MKHTLPSHPVMMFPLPRSVHDDNAKQHATDEQCHKCRRNHGTAELFILPPVSGSSDGLVVADFTVCVVRPQDIGDGLRKSWLLWRRVGRLGKRGRCVVVVAAAVVGVCVELNVDVVVLWDGCVLSLLSEICNVESIHMGSM